MHGYTSFSSPEQKAHRWAYSKQMVLRPSVRHPQFLKIFFSETAWPIKAKLYVEPPWVGGTKVYSRHMGYMTKMAATSIYMYGKNPSKSSSRNQQADFYETLYVASETPVHHSLFKWWPWSDLDLFYGKVKFGNIGFYIGKSENSGFSKKIAACDLKVGRCRQLIKFTKVCEYRRSRSFLDLGPRSFTYEN